MRREARILRKMRVDGGNVEPLMGLVLDFVIVEDCARSCGNLGHNICEMGGIIPTDELLNESDLRTFAGDDQVSRVARPRFSVSCRDEDQVNGLLANRPARKFNIGPIREECRVPCSKRVIGRAGVPPQMVFDAGCRFPIPKSFADRPQMEIQLDINCGECRMEPAVNKYETCLTRIQFRNRWDWLIDWRLKCDSAKGSYIGVFPILQLRRRKTERKEVVHPLLPQPFDPRPMATGQVLSHRGELSAVDVLFCNYRAHETFLDGCGFSRGCALSRLRFAPGLYSLPSAAACSSSHPYPFSSSSIASSLLPERMMRPPITTCTRSRTTSLRRR